MQLPDILLMPKFGKIDLDVFVSRPILTLFFIGYLAVYIVLSFILFYHWRTYGMKSRGVVVAESIFVVVAAVLFLLAALSLTLY
ncbi:MAG: hypothetical protein WAW92_00060 [Minisyncoccia bacterium]